MSVQKECNGICMSGWDIGIPSSGIAHAHPDCELHGDPDTACPCCEGWGSHYGDDTTPPGENDAYVCAACNRGTVPKDQTEFTCKGWKND